jgi:vancomycin resistance protein VanW
MLSAWHPWLYHTSVFAHQMQRHVYDLADRGAAAQLRPEISTNYLVAEAGSVVLRRLADVNIMLQHNKRRNLELAIATLDSRVLRPGESLSFWRCVGNPTARRGYLPGLVLAHGRLQAAVGGGLCQLSNLLHWLALHTPLLVVERHHHGHDSFPDVGRVVPFGTGATVFYNYLDLRLRNEGPEAYRLRLWLTEEELRGEIRSDRPPNLTYKIVEEDHRFRRRGPGVFRENRLFRATQDRETGAPVGRELLAHNVFPVLYQPGPEVAIQEET